METQIYETKTLLIIEAIGIDKISYKSVYIEKIVGNGILGE
jgi:hypothetical protein